MSILLNKSPYYFSGFIFIFVPVFRQSSKHQFFIHCDSNCQKQLLLNEQFLSYCELVDARISASEKDLPVPGELLTFLLINMDFFFVPCSNDPKFKLWGPREPS